RQINEKVKFLRSEAHFAILDVNRAGGKVYAEGPDLDELRLGLLRRRDTSKGGAYPRQELVHIEGLGDVIVGTGIQRLHFDFFFSLHGKHDEGDRGLGPNMTTQG